MWGPAVRDHFLIHYILDGKGTFHTNGVTYSLKKGQGFLICPNVISSYQSDSDTPWSYCWVGFHGLKAESFLSRANLTAETPILIYDNDDTIKQILIQMVEMDDLTSARELHLLSLLYLFLAKLTEAAQRIHIDEHSKNRIEQYIKKAVEFIELNYSRRVSIGEMSSYIGLDRSYVYSIFKSYLNVSPQHFLINFRITKACELMNNNGLSIGDISRSVGYEDPLLFSKMFKKVKGMSPREYRRGQF